jgi:hypothetical protein
MGTRSISSGFADDCRVEGKVDLEDARLADLLNRHPTIVVHDVKLVSTLDGHTQEFDELEIKRDELDIVVASGPRGDPKRRLATKPNGVTMKLGPYCAEGFMHAPPTANPVRSIGRRPPWSPSRTRSWNTSSATSRSASGSARCSSTASWPSRCERSRRLQPGRVCSRR